MVVQQHRIIVRQPKHTQVQRETKKDTIKLNKPSTQKYYLNLQFYTVVVIVKKKKKLKGVVWSIFFN